MSPQCDALWHDMVVCTSCGAESTIERDSDTCPACGLVGCLQDVEQDVECHHPERPIAA